ncbi:tetratricopeptide repeat protein [Aneurinibacillus sp. REN35]|uniref:tetratricopeptide repeat protein n=1 Tax=Aneurinibacillus sp. REN35 TaxID=3237286 RepID=UPI003527BA29
MPQHDNEKVVLFPGLVEKRLREARAAAEESEYDQALEHVQELLRITPDDPEALLTAADILIQANRFEEAMPLVARLWEERTGDTAEIFRAYLGLLLKLEDFNRIEELLTQAVEIKELMPFMQEIEAIRETFQMVETQKEQWKEDELFSRQSTLKKAEADPTYITRLYEKLEGGTFEEQLGAIEQLKYIPSPETISVIKEYLMLVYPEPMLKTFALRALKQMGEVGPVYLYKFDQKFETLIEDTPMHDEDMPEGERAVLEHLSHIAYKQDASFISFAFQLWMEYLFSIYPLHPEVDKPGEWAAALHYSVAKLLRMEESGRQVAKLYHIPFPVIEKNFEMLTQVLQLESRSTDL